jgi:ABC-type bacteriocin/lantibiotic exporter with double-glycine peptidase domain
MILLYRDRTNTIIFSLPDNIEAMGRITNMIKEFDEFINKNESITDILEKIADSKINNINNELKFDKIRFEDVSFQYKGKDTKVFDHLTKEIYLKNKIIGIVGPSGKGKSTIMKLVIRLYEPDSGKIYIDDIDITTLDPDFIREHITYVNQNSRLFDKKVLENIFYGCKEQSSCDQLLKEIMEHSKIQELYKNVDIINGPSGALGEKLSGGQRQVINIISGLINPTEILILDEPTNALDNDLKREILTILQKFRKYKKCIMIITHDHDVYPLFDETIEL